MMYNTVRVYVDILPSVNWEQMMACFPLALVKGLSSNLLIKMYYSWETLSLD